jgi:AcrR family transcriptional regulator
MAARVNKRRKGAAERLRACERHRQILDAALELFSEAGFRAPTRDLARRAGVSEALIFRHFPTKEALIREILNDAEARARVLEDRFREVPPREALRLLAEQVLTKLRENPRFSRVVFYGVLEMPGFGREFYGRFLSRLLALETRLFRRAFQESPRRAGFARVDPGVVARSFHGSLMFYNLAGAVMQAEEPPKNPKRLAEAIVNLYLPESA